MKKGKKKDDILARPGKVIKVKLKPRPKRKPPAQASVPIQTNQEPTCSISPAILAFIIGEVREAVEVAAQSLLREWQVKQDEEARKQRVGRMADLQAAKQTQDHPDRFHVPGSCNKCGSTYITHVYRKESRVLECTCQGCRDHWTMERRAS